MDPHVFNVSHNGKNVRRDDTIIKVANGQDVLLNLYIPVLGGKGGFGSMLRAIGAQTERTTNREACRDLGGRRLRDVHAEKRIKDWISKQGDRKKEHEEKKKKKLAKLAAEPKVDFNDKDYFQTRESIPDQLEDAIEAGLRKANPSVENKPSEQSVQVSSPSSSTPLPSSSTPSSSPSPSQPCVIATTESVTTQESSTVTESKTSVSSIDSCEANSSKKRKSPPKESQGSTSSSQKRSKSFLWTGVDEDTSSDDNE